MTNNNNQCDAAVNYGSIHQLNKKEDGKERKPIFPVTPIQAVYDARTGASLETILAQFNAIYVQYQGTPEATRNIIPEVMRRAGLTITYMDMESNTITERANSAVQKDNDHWGLDVNWSRVDELSLSGDISVSSKGTWIINGKDTGVKALGPKGDTGLTPWLKTIDNKLHFSYDNVTWESCSENIAAWFRFNATSSDSQAGTIGRIQISRDNKTWTDLSPEFRNYLRIQGYVATTSALPANQVVGTIYGVGPTYAADDIAHTNPIYRLHVWNGSSWVDNGQFTSIAAGVVQETGNSETEVMSQKAVTEKLSELGSKVAEKVIPITTNGDITTSESRIDYELKEGEYLYIQFEGAESLIKYDATYRLISRDTNNNICQQTESIYKIHEGSKIPITATAAYFTLYSWNCGIADGSLVMKVYKGFVGEVVTTMNNESLKNELRFNKNESDINRLATWGSVFGSISINTSDLTFNINSGNGISLFYGRGVYTLIDYTSSCKCYVSGNKSSYCKIVLNKETLKLYPKVYYEILEENEIILAVVRTTYGEDNEKKFTRVDIAGGEIVVDGITYFSNETLVKKISNIEKTIENIPKYATGYYEGESINIKKGYVEESIELGVISSLFNSSTETIGNQGSDIQDDRYVIYVRLATNNEDYNSQKYGIVVVDIENKSIVGEFEVSTGYTKSHGNNLNLGGKYAESDKFRLIYVSNTFSPYDCKVLRINDDAKGYTLVQTISYNGTDLINDNPQSIDFCVDVNKGELYLYAAHYTDGRRYVKFKKYSLPSTSFTDVVLDDNSVDSFTIDNLRIAHGCKIVGDKMYMALGYDAGDEWLKVIDLSTKSIVSTLPLSYEPEGVGVYRNKIAIMPVGFLIRTYKDE